jgi:DNA-binding response OmpR family regulator
VSDQPRVLVVDDTPANIRLLDAVLRPRGFDIVTASSGQEALDAIAMQPPDVVLLDVQMPGMNGYEVCRRVREDPQHAALPIIMVTASLSEERALALEAGADDFVVRPFDQAELVARVRSLVRIKSYHDQLQEQARELAALNESLEERVEQQVDELEKLRRLRRFLSPHLADVVLDSGELLQPHRREIAVVLGELRGFDAISMSAEPEEAVDALKGFHEILGRLVASYEATVGYFAGDGVMMFFNDPLPCTDPVLRAARLAVELREAMREYGDAWRRRGRSLDVAASVTLGYATLGMIGFDGRYDYSAVGTVVNQAARLCEAAADGEILLSQRAHAAVEETVTASVWGDVELRGAPAIQAWRLDGLTGPSAPGPDFRILGPLEVVVDGQTIELTAAKERAVLSLLLMRAGEIVSAERLADELWEGEPPESALSTLRAHVSRLRKALAAAGLDDVVVTKPTGYVVQVDESAIDARRFERLLRRGRAALATDPASAQRQLREAVGIWRGPALVDVAGTSAAEAEIARLEECRLAAIEDCIEADLACGRHRDVLTELEGLTRLYPLRERLWAQRMTALYRSGRQPEALRIYQELRTQLAEELGLDPSPELTALEQAIVTRSLT